MNWTSCQDIAWLVEDGVSIATSITMLAIAIAVIRLAWRRW